MNVTLLNVKKNVTESFVNFDVIVNFGIVQKCFLVHNSHLPVKKELKRFAKKALFGFSLDLTEKSNKLSNM